MDADYVQLFEAALLAIGTRGEAARTQAVQTLEGLATRVAAPVRNEALAVVEAVAQAEDFLALWAGMQSFVPFLSHLELPVPPPSPPVAEAPPEPPEIPAPEPAPPNGEALLAELHEMASGTDELQDFNWVAPPLPEEMLADFFAEVAEHLEEVAQLVLRVQGPDDPDMVELYRKLHTVKGNSGMVGLHELQEVTHGMEDVVKELRSRKLPPSDALRKVLADGTELAATILRLAEEGGQGQLPVQRFTRELRATLEGNAPAAAPAAPRVSAPEVVAAAAPPSPSAGGAAGTDGSGRPAVAGKRMLRVDFEQVDQLAALVGEQAVRQEEVGKFIERMEEGVEELHRQLSGGGAYAVETARKAVDQARTVSKDLAAVLAGLEGTSQALGMVSTDIQRTVLNLRMTPLEALFAKHRMTVFQAANAQGKKANLVVEAGDAKLDKSLAEKLEEPLIHLIRNAVSHGIQRPEERLALGKPAQGTVTIRAYHQGNQVVVQVEDDGVGIVADVIRKKAVEKGFLTEEESRKSDDRRIVDMIFAPGFSTTTQVDDVSGRGVGLDVVRDKINRISGAVEIISQPGKGTIFQLTLPLTLALARVLLADVAGEMTALPADAVLRVEALPLAAVVTVDGRQMVRLDGETLPLVHLARTLGLSTLSVRPAELVAAIASFGNQRAALVVDRILLPTQAVVREVGPVMPAIPHCMGVTFHEGQCVLIVDVGSIIRAWGGTSSQADAQRLAGAHCIVTRDAACFYPLGRVLLHGPERVTLMHPSRLTEEPLVGVATILLDGRLDDLEMVAERCANLAPDVPLVVLATDGKLGGRNLERLFDAGAQDVWPLADGWSSLARRLARSETGGRR
jgi:two-component system chemotaxis sensor kinase CheA